LPLEADKQAAVQESHHRVQLLASMLAGEQDFPGPFSFRARSGDLETVLVDEAADAGVLVVGVPQRERHDDFLERLSTEAQCAVVAVDENGNTRVIGTPFASSTRSAAS